MSEKKQPNLIQLGIFLGIIGAVAAGLLAGVALMTKKPIAEAQLKKTSDALKDVLPPFNNIPAEEIKVIKAANNSEVKFYIAKMDGKIVGIAGEGTSTKGYAGDVTVMLGLDLNGKITKVIVTKQGETPGLGTVVTDRKREKTIFDLFNKIVGKYKKPEGLPPNSILDGFDDQLAKKGSKPWLVKKDGGKFDFLTGATITSRAVTDAVYTVDSTFVLNKEDILKTPPSVIKPAGK